MHTSLSVRRSTPRYLRRSIYAFAAALWLSLNVFVPATQAQKKAEEQLIARKPFVATVVTGVAATKNKRGTPLAVTMPQGINGLLQIVDLKKMQRVLLQEQRSDDREMVGQAYVTLPNRHVLVATNTGNVYDVDPDKLAATDQTPPNTSGISFNRGVLGDDGAAYFTATDAIGSTHVYRYTYGTTSWRDIATVPAAGGGLGYDNGAVFVGNTRATSVWRVGATSGSVSEIALAGISSGGVRVELSSGGYLYATAGPQTYVYALPSMSLVDQRPAFGAMSAPAYQPPETVTPTQPTTETTTESDTAEEDTTADTTDEDSSDTSTDTQDQTTDTDTTTDGETTNTDTDTDTTQPADQDTEQNTVVETPVAPVAIPEAPVYYGVLNRYEPTTKSISRVAGQSGYELAAGNCWIDTNTCVAFNQRGGLAVVNKAGRYVKAAAQAPITGGYHSVGALEIGEDDTMYAASSANDPAILQVSRDELLLSKMVAQEYGQVSSLQPIGEHVVAGTADGKIVQYEPTVKAAIPQFSHDVTAGVGTVSAMTKTASNKVAFALNTRTGGSALGIYSTVSRSVVTAPVVVSSDRQIVSLAYAHGVVYAGLAGGSGGAAVIAYDVTTKQTAGSAVPSSSAHRVTSLVASDEGVLYGVADTTLFAIDTDTMNVIKRKSFFATGAPGNVVLAGDKLVASVAGKIYDVNPADFKSNFLMNGTHVAVNSFGDYYYSRDGALYRKLVPRTASAANGIRSVGGGVNLSLIDLRFGISSALLILAMIAIPVLKLHWHRPTYVLRR